MRLATRSLWLTLAVAFVLSGFTSDVYAGSKIKKPIATGKDFFVVFPKATWGNQSVGVLINSPSKQKITVTTPTGQKGIIDIKVPRTTQYYAGQFRIQNDPEVVKRREATRITSPNPISVHGQFGVGGISGTYTAIPVSAWGNEYYAIAPAEGVNSAYYYYPTIYSVPMITIIGSHAGTSVTIVPTAPTAKGHQPDIPYTITLNEGDVYNVTTQGDPKANPRLEDPCNADLTGTHIISTFPVGVLCAQTHNTWPCGDNECGDYCVEFIPPVCNWDSLYVITPSVPRAGGAVGEALRIVFGHDGTDLIVDDGNSAPRNLGTFAAGQFMDYPSPIGTAIILQGSHPFLPVEITRKPEGCFVGTSGGENWTLGMVVLSGVNQWGDYTPFSTAAGSQSVGNIFFRYAQRANIRLNGKRLVEMFPVVKQLPQGYATVPIPVNPATYQELTGDSGATAGGSIFGFGTLRYGANDNGSGDHVQDPEVIKSFAHPIGVNALAACNPDITPPHMTDTLVCGHWTINAYDDELTPPATGVYDIYLAYNAPPDTSFNVVFDPAPSFPYGASRVGPFGITVINQLLPAQASIHIRDGAGNEFDTLLTYTPPKVTATPQFINAGAVRVGDSVTMTMILKNLSATPVTFNGYRLRHGAAHHWQFIKPPTPTAPFTIAPGDSVTFMFQYNSPNVAGIEFDDDTLFLTTCREFPIATLLGTPKRPGINTACYDFGNRTIDTLTSPGETASSLTASAIPGVWVTSIGSDTLHITDMEIGTYMTGMEPGFPASDFKVGKVYYKDTTNMLPMPTIAAPWLIAPNDTVFVEILGHPHHSGPRLGWIHFDNDASGVLLDTACLTMFGLAPGIYAQGIDYGTHLYATTMDSFFVVKNTGSEDLQITKGGFTPNTAMDTGSFAFHEYFDSTAHGLVHYDSTVANDLFAATHDTTRVPYRFISKKLGPNSLDLVIENTSPVQPTITLKGVVVQPHIFGSGSCPSDSTYIGGTLTQDVLVGNQGTHPLTIEQVNLAGGDANAWTLGAIKNKTTGTPLSLPMTLQIGDTASITLTFSPLHVGLSNATVSFVGSDAMGRHANDSTIATAYYKWNVFPYDTTVEICNHGYATGIAHQDLHLEQYVTLDTSGIALIKNTGAAPITVSNITEVGADVNSYVFATYKPVPFTIPPYGSDTIMIDFKPNPNAAQPLATGRRNYATSYIVENNTGTADTVHFTGRGHMVDMHTSIPRDYVAMPGAYVPVSLNIDSYVDTLGKSDFRGFIMEVVHYRRTIVRVDEAYNTSGNGGTGTNSQGASFVVNRQETDMSDTSHPLHNIGQQGYYELNTQFSPQNLGRVGTLMRINFKALIGRDTSELTYKVSNPIHVGDNALMSYVNIVDSAGLITVDSVCGLNLRQVRYNGATLALQQNSPNPFTGSTSINFSQPVKGHVKLTIVNTVGDVVAVPVDQDLPAGHFVSDFDGTSLPSGIYTYRLETATGTVQKQMMLMR